MASKPKYVADGFQQDVTMLVYEFVEKGSEEFPVFASLFRERGFQFIFQGREGRELATFTNEIFCITTQYLLSNSFLHQVGGIFMLYSLYRVQPSIPLIKIRILLEQWHSIRKVLEEAVKNKHKTLYYVIDYLLKNNAFDYVAYQRLMGPLTPPDMKPFPTASELVVAVITGPMTQNEGDKILEEIRDLRIDYDAIKKRKKIPRLNADDDLIVPGYNKLIRELKGLRNFRKGRPETEEQNGEVTEDIGSRRAKLKAAAFSKNAEYRNREASSDSDYHEAEVQKPETRKVRKRLPPHERRLGRPRKRPILKNDSGDELEEDGLMLNDNLLELTNYDIHEMVKHNEEFLCAQGDNYLLYDEPRRQKPLIRRFYYAKGPNDK